jgi:DNA-binding MarR family transcriptional regulator
MFPSETQTAESVPAAARVYTRLLRARAATTRCLSSALLADHGLTINDYEALHALSQADGWVLKRIDLARSLVLTPSGVTRLLEGLEEAGLVERASCPTDLRVSYARLTARGAATLARASRDHERAVAALLSEHLTAEEIDSLGDLLGKLPGVAGDEPGFG